MKLSEAIRLGSLLGPQAYGSLTRRRRKYLLFGPVVNEYCAMGAAFAASGAPTVTRTHASDGDVDGHFRGKATQRHKAGETYLVVEHPWVFLMCQEASCPLCPGEVMPIYRVIPHLNDDHRWTRGQIADFIERFESPEYAVTVDETDKALV